MKTILIPTDFTVKSLNVLKKVLEDNSKKEPLKIFLVHGHHNSTSITDMLFFSKNQEIRSLSSQPFLDACEVLKNKFPNQISFLILDIFSGYYQSNFNDYLKINKIDQIYICDNIKQTFKSKRSFNLNPFIEKSKFENIVYIELDAIELKPETGQVSDLFINSDVA